VLPRTVTTNAATQQVTYGNVYKQLLEYIVSADLVFYLLMVVAVIVLRGKRPNADRPYRTWGYPIVPVISIVLSALLTIDLVWLAPATSGTGILIVLTGVPAFFVWRLRDARHASPV
jgi:APA family basic amino acid/polyamine antiporter